NLVNLVIDLRKRRHSAEIEDTSSHHEHEAQIILLAQGQLTLNLLLQGGKLTLSEWGIGYSLQFPIHKPNALVKLIWFSAKGDCSQYGVKIWIVVRVDRLAVSIFFAHRHVQSRVHPNTANHIGKHIEWYALRMVE